MRDAIVMVDDGAMEAMVNSDSEFSQGDSEREKEEKTNGSDANHVQSVRFIVCHVLGHVFALLSTIVASKPCSRRLPLQ